MEKFWCSCSWGIMLQIVWMEKKTRKERRKVERNKNFSLRNATRRKICSFSRSSGEKKMWISGKEKQGDSRERQEKKLCKFNCILWRSFWCLSSSDSKQKKWQETEQKIINRTRKMKFSLSDDLLLLFGVSCQVEWPKFCKMTKRFKIATFFAWQNFEDFFVGYTRLSSNCAINNKKGFYYR